MSYGTSDTDQAEYNFFPILFAIVFFLVLAPLVCISLGQQASMQKVPVTIEGVRTASACRALAIVERKEDAKDATREAKLVCLSEKGKILEQVVEVPPYIKMVKWIFPDGGQLESK